MNLVIDQGNTFTKIGVFDKGNLIHSDSLKKIDKAIFKSIQSTYSINKTIFSSVQADNFDKQQLRQELGLNDKVELLILDDSTHLPINSHYKTPHTLGKDRIAALVGAYSLHKGAPKLVIDAGTAITIDYLDAHNTFTGGNISPGIQTRFNALHQNTKKLPLLKLNNESPFLGLSTNEAIWSGVQNGAIFEIEAYINHFNTLNINTKTILTGGDAYFFAKNLKNPIFVNLNLVQTGLNTILEYNAKDK
ncbi:type III pantothenate kinase [Saccharicrinis fermentans]|uniref:Type III pantothenate kinase n=1 Tax=Saccharicrinis fermentans DSM 9555 = JCM 21142 TaxID=869213 RepID=W7YSD1_9BACT|nr:type III pantothenate kinase [Saccharicrinis fermentans]GAF05364.1 type III pantothenate kinase [Saccharicrinis fermentans DSM 9555 = JCM 21142]